MCEDASVDEPGSGSIADCPEAAAAGILSDDKSVDPGGGVESDGSSGVVLGFEGLKKSRNRCRFEVVFPVAPLVDDGGIRSRLGGFDVPQVLPQTTVNGEDSGA